MDKHTIAKEIRDNFDSILSQSLENCHVFGLNSVVLSKNSDGLLRRMFVTSPSHELWKNEVDDFYDEPVISSVLSLGIHPHHCQINFQVLKGRFTNYLFNEKVTTNEEQSLGLFNKYRYESVISGKEGKFILEKENIYLNCFKTDFLKEGDNLILYPRELHTVYVSYRDKAAWLVEESNEDDSYEPICYSNADLENFSFKGMYKPMSEKTLLEILNFLDKDEYER